MTGAGARRPREEFFAKPRARLRSSPLPMRHGWGPLFDHEGRTSLCPMESDEYAEIIDGARSGVTVRKALRGKRA